VINFLSIDSYTYSEGVSKTLQQRGCEEGKVIFHCGDEVFMGGVRPNIKVTSRVTQKRTGLILPLYNTFYYNDMIITIFLNNK